MWRRVAALSVVANLAAAGGLIAQVPPVTGAVVGFVLDSIHAQPLRNAFVVLDGTAYAGVADSSGAFVINDVPPGTYHAVLLHQLLDVLRIAVRTEPVTVTAGDTLRLFVAVPSASTVLRRRCESNPQQPDTAALFGVVTDADGNPADGATVLLAWRQVVVSRELGVRETEQHRAAATLPDGTFSICGLPDDLAADARVARSYDTSDVVTVRIPLSGIAVVELGLPESGGAAGGFTAGDPMRGGRGSGVVRGRVVNRRGQPVQFASLTVGRSGTTVSSDSSGAFVLAGQRAGSQMLTVRRLGYEVREVPLLLRRGARVDLEIVLDDFVPLLEEVVVRARRDAALERVGFATRARVGSGFYLPPEQLQRMHASRVSDYLVAAPMLRVTGSGSNRRVTGRRGEAGSGCVAYSVDGQRWTGPAPDEAFNPKELGAIEVYPRGLAPALFLGINDCDVVMLWTKSHLGL